MASGHYIRQQISGSLGWPFNASQPLYAHDWLRRYALFANSLLPSVNSQIHSVLFWRNFYLSCFKCLVFFFFLDWDLDWNGIVLIYMVPEHKHFLFTFLKTFLNLYLCHLFGVQLKIYHTGETLSLMVIHSTFEG